MSRVDQLSPGDRRRFRTGRPSLDLTHTGGEGEFAVWEIVHTAVDLGRWLGVILDLPGDVAAGEADLAPMRALRAAITRIARGLPDGTAPAPADVALLNAAAAAPALVPVLRPGASGSRVEWRAPPAPATPGAGRFGQDPVALARPTAAAALATLARDAVDLFGGPLAGRIRICTAGDCGLLFVDASRPGKRRWCSMQRCGTLAKVRRHRAQQA